MGNLLVEHFISTSVYLAKAILVESSFLSVSSLYRQEEGKSRGGFGELQNKKAAGSSAFHSWLMSQWDDVSYQHAAHGGERRKVYWSYQCSNHRQLPLPSQHSFLCSPTCFFLGFFGGLQACLLFCSCYWCYWTFCPMWGKVPVRVLFEKHYERYICVAGGLSGDYHRKWCKLS